MKKKTTFEQRRLKSFIDCSFYWQMLQFQVAAPRLQAYRLNTKSQFAELVLCHSSGVFEVPSKLNLPINNLIKPLLVVWGSDCKNYRKPTATPKNWSNKRPTAIKKLIRFFTIKDYRLYLKPFKRNWLAVITTIFWPAILASKKLVNCWPKNTTGQSFATMSRPMWKVVRFA